MRPDPVSRRNDGQFGATLAGEYDEGLENRDFLAAGYAIGIVQVQKSSPPGTPANTRDTSVAVVVTTCNYAHFLADALESIAAQTRPPEEVIVIDDGSADDPGAVVERFPGVTLVSFANRGLSMARNEGLALATSRFVAFLDADDILRPGAIAAGLACMAGNPGAGFVYGAHRVVDARLTGSDRPQISRVGPRAYHDLLVANHVSMHGTVLYDREKLLACGGFDPQIERCEDYDMYLRMARRYRVASHGETVADYRRHEDNMSHSVGEQVNWAYRVHARHRPPESEKAAMAAWNAGQRYLRRGFAHSVWLKRPGMSVGRKWAQRAEMLAKSPRMATVSIVRRLILSLLPERALERLRELRRRRMSPQLGRIDFGDLMRLAPISSGYGFKRGTPVDRFYIERFLARCGSDIRGRVLEAGDATYSKRFGGEITRQDVLNLQADSAVTTIAGDLGAEDLLDPAAYDCLVMTQVLQLIFDVPSAIRRMHASLAPGGVVLATVPGISPVDPGADGSQWNWTFTQASARKLFEDAFGAENVDVACHGNVFAATCFLQGIALEDVGEDWIDHDDPAFPLVVTIRAQRAA